MQYGSRPRWKDPQQLGSFFDFVDYLGLFQPSLELSVLLFQFRCPRSQRVLATYLAATVLRAQDLLLLSCVFSALGLGGNFWIGRCSRRGLHTPSDDRAILEGAPLLHASFPPSFYLLYFTYLHQCLIHIGIARRSRNQSAAARYQLSAISFQIKIVFLGACAP